MNPVIVSAIIASASVITSIFAANWLNQQHVNKLVDQIEKRLVEQGDRFESQIRALREVMEAKFAVVGARFDSIASRLDAIERRLDALEQRVKRLEDILFKPTIREG